MNYINELYIIEYYKMYMYVGIIFLVSIWKVQHKSILLKILNSYITIYSCDLLKIKIIVNKNNYVNSKNGSRFKF